MNSLGRFVTRAFLSGIILGSVSGVASAHPPYEWPAAAVVDTDGHQLSVVKVYTDGIFFTDPVRLEVRDTEGSVLARTGAGRDVSLLCLGPSRCVAFRYDGLMPIVAEDAWWLEGAKLRRSDSLLLYALGVVMPLWDHWLGYVVALGFLYLPLAALRRAWGRPTTPLNGLIVAVVGLSAAGLWLVWLYVVVLLSYLSLPLVAALAVGVWYLAARVRRSPWLARLRRPKEILDSGLTGGPTSGCS